MRRALGLSGTALMAAALLTWAPATTSGWNQGQAEATLWQLMNGARVNNGRRALLQHGTLVSLARWRSRDQVQRDYFSHTVLGTGYQVYHWYDTNGLSYSWGGENIGWNSGASDGDSPVMIHEGFMNSPGHRANVLEPAFTHGGVGAFGADNVMFLGKQRSPRFYTELFMVARSAPPPPPPPPPGNTNPPPPPPPAPSVAGLGEATLVASLDRPTAADAARALARADDREAALGAPAEVAASPMRVEAASTHQGGLVETVLGSLLGFFL